MEMPHCSHLVWFSRKAVEYRPELFAWIVAHELRHIFQSRLGYPRDCIRIAMNALRKTTKFNHLPSSKLAPEEIDSDICGMRVVRELFGKKELNIFLSSSRLPRCPFDSYPRLLEEVSEKCFHD